jgi:hypothetical protein
MTETTTTTTTLAQAWVAALSELTTLTPNSKVETGAYDYKYVDLGELISTTRPILAKHGLVATTPIGVHEQGLAVSVHVFHVSGETLVFGPFPFPAGKNMQATGSAVTYARRYALGAALGIATDPDDDGQLAVEDAREARPVEKPSKPRKPAPAKKVESPALQAARAAADRLGDAARTVVPSIIGEVTGRQTKLVDLSEAELEEVTSEILGVAINQADSPATVGEIVNQHVGEEAN